MEPRERRIDEKCKEKVKCLPTETQQTTDKRNES